MSIDISRKQEAKVREDLNVYRLKQDGQECQDLQDGAARTYGPKVWKTLMSIEFSRRQDDKVREDLNMQRLLRCVRGTGPRATGTRARFFRRRVYSD